jgi:hypothetical protein
VVVLPPALVSWAPAQCLPVTGRETSMTANTNSVTITRAGLYLVGFCSGRNRRSSSLPL